MHTAALIFTCFSGMVAFACLITGYCALLAPDAEETRRLQERIAEAGKEGQWAAYLATRDQPFSIVAHWKSRPSVRWLFLVGFVSLVAALVAGWWV